MDFLFGRVAFTWDANGNLTSDGVRSYSYDYANRLTQVVSGTLTTQYAYNGDGVRTAKTVGGDTTEYVLDLMSTLPVVISDTDAVYLYGLDIIAQQQSEMLCYMDDGLGSVRQLLDSTGEVQTNYAYDPFGVPAVEGGVSNPYQYTGEAWDAEVELLYLRARYYQPETGRFVTRDPWMGDTWRPGTLNGYLYALNNPVNRVDPTGRQATEPTPTATDRERETLELIEQSMERPAMCVVRMMPQQTPAPVMWEMSAVNPGVGLVFQRTVLSGERGVTYWVEYVELTPEGPRVAIASGYVESSLQLTVKVYMNGSYVDVFDTYDTENLWSLAQGLECYPSLDRSVRLYTNRGVGRGPFDFTTVERKGNPWRLGPFSSDGARELNPLEPAQVGETGTGHVYGRTWFPAGEGLPSAARMDLLVPEMMGGQSGWALGDWPSFGAVGSYLVVFGQIYPSH